ncbi:B-cell lymphoma 3 protein isoform X1 [Anguilla rostrata]|uniref:B-cell lymphoma 3 protein isoform X1 n=2 Tax=Anguilla rostrata TaxID=7938 RepID=UPI0030D42165
MCCALLSTGIRWSEAYTGIAPSNLVGLENMTTSGQQTTATPGPLDLRTKRRHGKVSEEDGVNHSESEKAQSRNGNSMDNAKVKVEEMFVHSQGGSGNSNGTREAAIEPQHPSRSTAVPSVNERALKTDPSLGNNDCPMTLDPRSASLSGTSSLKCETDGSTAANCESRTMDQSVSKLPFRKRPFPAGQETNGPSRTPPGSELRRPPGSDEGASRCPAKQSRRGAPESLGTRPQAQPQPVPVNGALPVDPYRHMPTIASYLPYHGYPLFTAPGLIINMPVAPLPFPVPPPTELDHLSIDVVTWQDEDGDTALHIAVVQEQEDLVHRLIYTLVQAHKDLDIYNNLRQTPLHLAVITNQAGLVEVLLRAGSDPGALDRHGQTAAHLCCEHGLRACLERVLTHPSTLLCLEARNYEGLTPLHLAVQNGNKKLVKLLLNSRADIDAVDIKSGRSPLIHAVENNNIEMVIFLLENGCNVNAQSYSGNTALHSACGRGQVEVVRLLLRNGADSSLKNYHNDTALMVAKNKKVTDVLRGKGSRSQNPKPLEGSSEPPSPHRCTPLSQQHSANGTPVPSPSHTHHRSPLATHSASHSASHSPSAPPFTQSTESQPGEKEQQLQSVVVHPSMTGDHSQRLLFQSMPVPPVCNPYPSSISDCHMSAIIPSYRYNLHDQMTTVSVRTCYGPDNLPYLVTHHASRFNHGQSRPSSHCSDQSDASTMSISSDGKGES